MSTPQPQQQQPQIDLVGVLTSITESIRQYEAFSELLEKGDVDTLKGDIDKLISAEYAKPKEEQNRRLLGVLSTLSYSIKAQAIDDGKALLKMLADGNRAELSSVLDAVKQQIEQVEKAKAAVAAAARLEAPVAEQPAEVAPTAESADQSAT